MVEVTLAFGLLVALTEHLIEITFGRVFGVGKKYPQLGYLLPYLTALLGIALSFATKIGVVGALFATIGDHSVAVVPAVDYILTGVLISGGADWFHSVRPAQ